METETSTLIKDLAILIVAAGVVTLIFHLLRLPLLIGYLVAGFLVGPHFPLFGAGFIENSHIINQLSELGVVFLMFYMGMEFDLRKLKVVFTPAVVAVGLQSIMALFLGLMTAPFMGWSQMDGLFLGGLLAISSSMVTIEVLRSQGNLKRNYAQLAIGFLILEDILAVLLLVILTGVGVTGRFNWVELWQVSFLVGVFVVVIYFVGKLLARQLLRLLEIVGSVELITLAMVGLVLGVGELAVQFHFEIALGAFLAGSLVSQSSLIPEIKRSTEPFRHLFTAVFFATVGMLVNLQLLLERWLPIVVVSFFVIVGKGIACWFGVFLTGKSSRMGFRASVSKAQIGEFSFIIVALGQKLGVTDPGLTAFAVGVALVTILISPIISGKADFLYEFFEKRMPTAFTQMGRFYHNLLEIVSRRFNKIMLFKLIQRPLLQVLAYFFLFNGVILLSSLLARKVEGIAALSPYLLWIQIGIWLLGALLCLPFLIAIIRHIDVMILLLSEAIFSSDREALSYVKRRMRNIFHTVCFGFVSIGFSIFYLAAAAQYFPSGVVLGAFVVSVVGVGIFFWRRIVHLNSRLEFLFIETFNQQQHSEEEKRKEEVLRKISEKYPWPVSVMEVTVEDKSMVAWKKISEINLRNQTGVSIIGISRGSHTLYDPSPEIPLFPGDHIVFLGTKEQNEKAKVVLSKRGSEVAPLQPSQGLEISQIYLERDCSIVGESLAGADLRKDYGINVVGIQRGEEQITTPASEEILQAEDILLVTGFANKIEKFREKMGLRIFQEGN